MNVVVQLFRIISFEVVVVVVVEVFSTFFLDVLSSSSSLSLSFHRGKPCIVCVMRI